MSDYKIMGFKSILRKEDGINFIEGGGSKEDAEYQQWLTEGNVPDPADQPPPPTVYKEKNSIQLQLIAAGKMADARAILNRPGNEDNKDLWNGAYKIAYDDQAVRGMISAVGMDAEIVMSNATNWGG